MSATIITFNQQFDWYFYANENIVVVSGPQPGGWGAGQPDSQLTQLSYAQTL